MTLSDLLLVLIVAGILLQAVITGSAPAIRALRPVALPLAVYASVMIVLLPAHLSFGEVVKTGQRFELFLFPLLVGAFAALADRHLMMLQAYVLSATVLAVAWPLDLLAGQKNRGRSARSEARSCSSSVSRRSGGCSRASLSSCPAFS